MPRAPLGPIARRPRLLVGRVGRLVIEFWWRGPFKRLGIERVSVDSPAGRRLVWSTLEVDEMPRPIVDSGAIIGESAPRPKSKLFEKFPELQGYLSEVAYSDGVKLGSVQLSIRTRGSQLVAQLKIADHGGLRLTAEERSVDDALVLLEAALTSTPVPWERDPYPLDGAVKKKSK